MSQWTRTTVHTGDLCETSWCTSFSAGHSDWDIYQSNEAHSGVFETSGYQNYNLLGRHVLHRQGIHENVTTGGQDTMFKKTNHSEVPKADNNWDYKGQKSLRDYCSANVPGEGSFTYTPPPPLQAVANDTSKSTAPGSVLPGQGDINHGYNPGMGELSGGR